MKLFILSLCVTMIYADVSHIVNGKSEKDVKIVKQELDIGNEGSYQWAYETENGIQAAERGTLKNPQSEDAAEVVEGQASWTAPDGQKVEFSYVADENGYQPVGSHIPTPPPIPEVILRALEYIRTHPPAPERQ